LELCLLRRLYNPVIPVAIFNLASARGADVLPVHILDFSRAFDEVLTSNAIRIMKTPP
jgi:hypothetical protein